MRELIPKIAILVLVSMFGCKKPHQASEIENSIKYYDHLILKSDADSISKLYTVDGELGDIAKGQDSIKKFLNSFKNVKVLKQASNTSSIDLMQDTAIQKGEYQQCAVISDKDTITVKGSFIVKWVWENDKGWRIKKMTTIPKK